MSQSNGPSLVSRVVFGLLGSALFLSVALLPNLRLTWFYTGGRVHSIVVPLVAVIVALMWGTSFLTPGDSGQEPAG